MDSVVFQPGLVQHFMQKFFIFRKLDFGASELESENLLYKRIHHPATDDDFISDIDHFADQFQFIHNFGTSQYCKYWFFRFFDKAAEVLNLLFH